MKKTVKIILLLVSVLVFASAITLMASAEDGYSVEWKLGSGGSVEVVSELPVGTVIAQSVPADSVVALADTVTITVSKGPEVATETPAE